MLDVLIEAASELVIAFVYAAYLDATYAMIHHSGDTARYIILVGNGSDRHIEATMIGDGGVVRIPRNARLLVEPVASVMLRDMVVVGRTWTTQ